MNNSILDKPFRHHKWFKGIKLTKRQAIESFAECADFSLDKKPSKKQSEYLMDDIVYDNVIIYNSAKDRGSYKITDEEKDYFLVRRDFWRNFKKQLWESWKQETGYEDCHKPESRMSWNGYQAKKYAEIEEWKSFIRVFEMIH